MEGGKRRAPIRLDDGMLRDPVYSKYGRYPSKRRRDGSSNVHELSDTDEGSENDISDDEDDATNAKKELVVELKAMRNLRREYHK